ncbi:VCBS repeat-containing protein [Chryseolinea sp. H1M3-3]|uniref:VCBS repeat-containing protein n=1 Tax=Chryseolinea sp. H1M3-3 TaxID=3034144 RepID=UPI0023EB19BD|nr:VCBS repeat-containing protein [Chryseolinea sp. H1M3-3]
MIRNFYLITSVLFCVLLAIGLQSCQNNQKRNQLFYKVPVSQTNVNFENTLKDSDDFNIIEYLYFYNGGGVALGDINNDGLADIYFSSNQQSNKLYLNKGKFAFEDITSKAGVSGIGNWKTGVTMADVNGDGFLDIFVCGVGNYKQFNGRNQLFINNGNLTFSEKTDEYGLTFRGFSTQGSFFDYDNDGDLDLYLVNHSVHTRRSYGNATLRFQSDSLAGDKLYRNELIPTGKTYFNDVTSEAGILNSQIGYGLAVGISDLNLDGYLDIYVSNDFNENDYLYINQRNGTFTQELEKAIPHSSRFSMGNDIADINNDGLMDIVTLDMLPKNEKVIKTTAGEDPYEIYEFKLQHGYHYQFARNTLQLNRGCDDTNNLMFSDVASLAGIEATDWSWAPLLADFDNDGYKDLFVANGIVGRPNDLDYINFIVRDSSQRYLSDQQLVEQMPSGKVPNVFFRNQGNLSFQDVSVSWIGSEPSLSNGASYADLDNDGDLDLVVNNINEKAFLYRNDLGQKDFNFLKIKFEGNGANRFGIGAKVLVFTGNKKIIHEQIPSRGWLSSVDYTMHIGLGNEKVDSISIRWTDNKTQTLKTIQPRETITVKQSDAFVQHQKVREAGHQLLHEGIEHLFTHKENNFTAFNTERLIPHTLTTQGPKIAVGDVNGDKVDDFFVCGAARQPSAIFIQNKNGDFVQSVQPIIESDSLAEDVDATFADVDGNETLDLIVVGGGQEFKGRSKNLLARLYLNDGHGKFVRAEENLPDIFVNASCVEPGDVDNDGDIDLFIGGRVISGTYGVDPPSVLLINNGRGIFQEETSRLVQHENNTTTLGMVTDAVWQDVNNDARTDLVVVGEWMPITVMIQDESGFFKNKTKAYGLEQTNGWWNTISAHDFDKDGNVDFVVGNLGHNSRLKATINEPVSIFIGDIDNNNSLDHILTYYNQGERYPITSRDQLVKQIPSLRRKFLKYDAYKNVKLEDILDQNSQKKFSRKDAYTFSSVYVQNTGKDKFLIRQLPIEAQMFPIFSFNVDDLNDDGNADILMVGNLDAVQPDFGRYDAGYGLVIMGDGKHGFKSLEAQQSGFVVKGQGRDIKVLKDYKNKKRFAVSRNNASIKVFIKGKN